MEDKHVSFGLAIKNARLDCKLTQEQLAEQAGITCRYLIAIENEKKIPRYSVMYRLVHAMHISADRLFYPDFSEENLDRTQLLHMLNDCSEQEIHVLLTTAKALRGDI